MKRVCLFLLVSVCLSGYGQAPDTLNKKGFQRKLIADPKTAEKIVQVKDSEAKDKRNAIIWIGIGVFFLGVLVVGLSRRRKKIN